MGSPVDEDEASCLEKMLKKQNWGWGVKTKASPEPVYSQSEQEKMLLWPTAIICPCSRLPKTPCPLVLGIWVFLLGAWLSEVRVIPDPEAHMFDSLFFPHCGTAAFISKHIGPSVGSSFHPWSAELAFAPWPCMLTLNGFQASVFNCS